MKRVLVAAVGCLALNLPLAGSVNAAQGTNCPKRFTLAPVSVLGSDFVGIADNVDHDGLICVKSLKSGGGIFIDNTAP